MGCTRRGRACSSLLRSGGTPHWLLLTSLVRVRARVWVSVRVRVRVMVGVRGGVRFRLESEG